MLLYILVLHEKTVLLLPVQHLHAPLNPDTLRLTQQHRPDSELLRPGRRVPRRRDLHIQPLPHGRERVLYIWVRECGVGCAVYKSLRYVHVRSSCVFGTYCVEDRIKLILLTNNWVQATNRPPTSCTTLHPASGTAAALTTPSGSTAMIRRARHFARQRQIAWSRISLLHHRA